MSSVISFDEVDIRRKVNMGRTRETKGRYRIRPNGKLQDGRPSSYVISLSTEVAAHVPPGMEFTCEATEEGILFRPAPLEPEPDIEIPAWMRDESMDEDEEPASSQPVPVPPALNKPDKGQYGDEPELPEMLSMLPRNRQPTSDELSAHQRFLRWAAGERMGFMPHEEAETHVSARTEGVAKHNLNQLRNTAERTGALKPGRTLQYWTEITENVTRSWDPHASVSPAVVELVFIKLLLDGPMSQAAMWHDLDLPSACMSAACLILKDAGLIEPTGYKDHQYKRPSNIWQCSELGTNVTDLETYMKKRARAGH